VNRPRPSTGNFTLDLIQLMEQHHLTGVPGRAAATLRQATAQRDLETLHEWLPRLLPLMLKATTDRPRKPQP